MAARILQTIFQSELNWILKSPSFTKDMTHVAKMIANCNTPAIGREIIYFCEHCQTTHFMWSSCGSRYCPHCGQQKTTAFLQKVENRILPCYYYFLTFTVPKELHYLFKLHNCSDFYNIFMDSVKQTLMNKMLDKNFCGGTPGMYMMLQTWTRSGEFHPHVHVILTGGGYDKENNQWVYPKIHHEFLARQQLNADAKEFFEEHSELAQEFKTILKKKIQTKTNQPIPINAFFKKWVVDCFVANTAKPLFKYLAKYMNRLFVSDSNIINYDPNSKTVTFNYRDRQANNQVVSKTLSTQDFIKLYLQHVLPKGFKRSRYYGILSPAAHKTFAKAKNVLATFPPPPPDTYVEQPKYQTKLLCPKCKHELTFCYTRSKHQNKNKIHPNNKILGTTIPPPTMGYQHITVPSFKQVII